MNQDQWNKWKKDPSKWFWGLFYYNREDERLLVPKRNEWMGATINFAHPWVPRILSIIIVFWLSMGALIILFDGARTS